MKKNKIITQTKGGLLSPFLAFQRTKNILKYIEKNKEILDFGCDLGNLTKFVNKDHYTGFDINLESVEKAKKIFVDYKFVNEPAKIKLAFYDIIISMAVIEHVKNPIKFLIQLQSYLKDKNSIIVLTTPNPLYRLIHEFGSLIKLFSTEASEDHEELINLKKMKQIISHTELQIVNHKYFLFGANQVFVLKKKN